MLWTLMPRVPWCQAACVPCPVDDEDARPGAEEDARPDAAGVALPVDEEDARPDAGDARPDAADGAGALDQLD